MLNIHSVPGFIKKWFSDYVWHIKTNERTIYLTFDDGPIPVVTEFVLDILSKHNAYATFFCVGENILKHPDIFTKIIATGNKVGNHTYNHMKGWQVSDDIYIKNTEAFEKVFYSHTGSRSVLFRPPYGRIKTSQAKMLKNNYKIIMWDVLTCDYDKNLREEKCLKNAIKHTKNGSIVVFHDSLKAEKNLRYVLPRYIEHFSKLGYRFGLIS